MKIKNVKFIKSAGKAKDFPDYDYPEFAFFGRSNTGKSSLINMLTGRKSLVKTGAKPGVTKLVNFFVINDNISLADMPGYGYARVSKNIREKFMPLIKEYISNRPTLKIAFLLVDIRRVPGDFERDIVASIAGQNRPVAVIATKCDKLSKSQRIKAVKTIASEFMVDTNSIFLSSSKTREGKDEIHNLIEEFSG
ncbi:MAG: YihA family ribosome biogenesis GTP-binding protein [Spirochaetes bacterium]|nr:YihA family ribosome biogenesis GTP-binding protein [Spirochaetota bacterium]